jgi:hypothetical protein
MKDGNKRNGVVGADRDYITVNLMLNFSVNLN